MTIPRVSCTLYTTKDVQPKWRAWFWNFRQSWTGGGMICENSNVRKITKVKKWKVWM